MKTETFQKENGAWGWRIIDGEVPTDSAKEFPNEHAAQRNLLRTIQSWSKKPRPNPIPPATTEAKPKRKG